MAEPMSPELSVVIVLAAYFFPTIVAYARRVVNKGPTVVVNLFLGWTFIGWVIALAMAWGAPQEAQP